MVRGRGEIEFATSVNCADVVSAPAIEKEREDREERKDRGMGREKRSSLQDHDRNGEAKRLRGKERERERERGEADRVSRLADSEPFETQVEIIQLCVPC